MTLKRMVKAGDRVLKPSWVSGPATELIVDHVTDRDIAVCRYADGRLAHGVPATTSFIARFSDGSLNTWMEHAG